MTELENIVAEINKNYEVMTPIIGAYPISENSPYITICSGGIKIREYPCPCYCSTKEHAIRLWKEAFLEYAKSKNGKKIWWRIFPSMEEVAYREDCLEEDRIIFYYVRARLLIDA